LQVLDFNKKLSQKIDTGGGGRRKTNRDMWQE